MIILYTSAGWSSNKILCKCVGQIIRGGWSARICAALFILEKFFLTWRLIYASVALLERMDFFLSNSSFSHRKKIPFHTFIHIQKAAGQLWWHLWKLIASRRVISSKCVLGRRRLDTFHTFEQNKWEKVSIIPPNPSSWKCSPLGILKAPCVHSVE